MVTKSSVSYRSQDSSLYLLAIIWLPDTWQTFIREQVSHNICKANLQHLSVRLSQWSFHCGHSQSYFPEKRPENIFDTLPHSMYPTSLFSSSFSQPAARYDEPNQVISWVASSSFLFVKWCFWQNIGTFSDCRTCEATDGEMKAYRTRWKCQMSVSPWL